ncbi:hypothetical protein [Vibrio phage vB_VibM_10AMN]|uniref:Uncharacterized protein n=1 Tax=Staphylococcus phage vB_VibM_10AMN12 TaxID=3076785 RepID=A0AA96KSQ4_9CAUD|nr:hypothetical protein [Vibrio phage vB_VibM_10AMN]WNO47506.1 hypothetical protein [Staphylococcus phage vB_VibM_10AMN12]
MMTAQQRLQQLQEEIDTLEKEVGDVQEVLSYLRECQRGREESFAHTNKIPDEQEFEFKGKVDGKEVSVHLKESSVMKLLEDNPKVDQLRQAKIKMKKVEDLLGGDV